ncbi:MAG TPA: hypothetical protein VGK75_01185 [Casimicrobiaceae bacterium]
MLYLRVRRTWEKTSRIFDSRALTLAYKGGEKGVIVPENVPVVMVEPADRSLLVPGAHVVVYAAAQPDGTSLPSGLRWARLDSCLLRFNVPCPHDATAPTL